MNGEDWEALTGGTSDDAPEDFPMPFNWPNALSLSSYATGLAFLMGGHPAFALLSVFLDEADGDAARALGEESEFGANLDYSVDQSLAAFCAAKLYGWHVLPLLLFTQTFLRASHVRPEFGSARAVGMAMLLAR